MCIMKLYIKTKWQDFTPTQEYLDAVKDVTTVNKLDIFLDKIKYNLELKDYWDTPGEVIKNGSCDCDGYARLAVDILERIQNRKDVRFVMYVGYHMKDGVKNRSGHAVAVFSYMGKLAAISNSKLIINQNSYEDIGHIFYPEGLKFMAILNSEGKIISMRSKYYWFGTF